MIKQPRLKKKIAVVIPKYGLVGGGEQFALHLTEKIALNPGYDVHVFANKWKAVSGNVTFHFVPVIRFPRFLTTVSFAFFANAAIARQNFDLIHTHERIFHADVFTMHGVPHRFWIRQVRKKRMSLFDRVTAWVERRLISDSRCRFFLPVSSLAMEKFSQEFAVAPGRVKVIHPGIEFERFSLKNHEETRDRVRAKFGLRKTDIVILFVGMNFELKGLQELIAAVALARAKCPTVSAKLLVVGKGNEKKYRAIAASLEVEEDVHFVGVITEKIEAIYRASDIYALLSGFDTFGMTVLEAMGASLPVIVSHNVGAKDLVVDGENGFVVDRGNLQSISDKISILFSYDVRLRMGKAGSKVAEKKSWEEVAKKISDVYKLILSGR